MSGVGASPPGARPRSPRATLGRWLLAPDFSRERQIGADNWVEALLEPAALVTLVGLFVAGLASFGNAVAPDWDSRFLAPLAVVVSAEAFLYARRLARPSLRPKEWAALLVPTLLALRLLPYVVGPDDLASDLGWWWQNPASFFTAGFLANAVLLLLAWAAAFYSTLDLNRLRPQPGEILPAEQAARYQDLYDDGWRAVDHATPLRDLTGRVLWGGVALTFFAALAAIDVRQLLSVEALVQLVTFGRPMSAQAFSSAVLYFVVGLVLLAEAQYVRQRTAWQVERLDAPRNLAPRWVAAASGATALVVLVALALPTDYARTVSDLLELTFGAVAGVAQVVVGTVMLLLSVILSPLRWLFPSAEEGARPEPAIPPPVQTEALPPTPIPWLEMLRSVVFFLIALAVVAYCLSVLWRRRPPLPVWASVGTFGSALALLRRLFGRIARWGRRATERVVRALPGLRRPPAARARPAFRWLALSRLGRRELVEYFYLSTLERAARSGVPRARGETAAEFARRLPSRLPEVEADLVALTDAFQEVRYGPRPVDEGLVRAARAHWQRLKLRLRGERLGRLGRGRPEARHGGD